MMGLIKSAVTAVCLVVALLAPTSHSQSTAKVLCYYDGANFLIEGK